MTRSSVLLVLAGILAACQQHERGSDRAGRLEVSWTGKDHGTLSGPATAHWCGFSKLLEIQTVRGDTGLALALYPRRELRAGTFQVVEPARAESLAPAAAVALRWLGSSIVQGFQGDSGSIVLERSSSGLFSGLVTARARSVVDTTRIHLSGTFHDLALRPDSVGCTRPDSAGDSAVPRHSAEADAVPPDTGVH